MKSKKKVMYVITKSAWGGAQRYVFDLAANLSKELFDVAVACGGSGPLAAKLQAAGIRAINVPGLERDINFTKEMRSLFSLLKIFVREKPDVIHLNSSKVGGLGAVAGFICKFPSLIRYLPRSIRQSGLLRGPLSPRIIFTAHGWAFNEDRPRWQKSGIKFLSWLASIFQDKVIVISQADFDSARELMPARKLVMIPHGIAQPNFFTREEARRVISQKIGRAFNSDDLIIGSVAELNDNKGLKYLTEAMHLIKTENPVRGLRAVVIGDGEGRIQLQSHIDSRGLSATVFLAGFMPEAARLLKAFDIFVLPSLKEGRPYVIMEAMAAGLPVVASSVGGVPDLIEDGKSGFLTKAKDSKDLAAAIGKLTGEAHTRSGLGGEALEQANQQFNLAKMVFAVTAVYSGR